MQERLKLLEGLIPFAPRSVAEELERSAGGFRLLAPHRRRIARLLQRARGQGSAHPGDGAACAFPFVTRGAPVPGGLLYALAVPDPRPAACPLADAFPREEEMRRLLAGWTSLPLRVLPHPMRSSRALCDLHGGSAGAAFALAAEAARRGRSVPRDVVVSAALGEGPDGHLHLTAVGDCATKVRILEKEAPGSRFFCVPLPGETLPASDRVEVIALEEGPLQRLLDAVLPREAISRELLFRRMRTAESHFASQRYPDARRLWEQCLHQIREEGLHREGPAEAQRWYLSALTRLGAIEMHAGRPEAAERWFEQAAAYAEERPALPRLQVDDARLHAACALIDRYAPEEAAALLLPLAEAWRRRLEADGEGDERRRMLIACLGALRRLHLLRGEAEAAVQVQLELLRWCPASERARAFCDLGECLRRAGRHPEARLALGRAWDELGEIPLETYRKQTEAFLLFYEGRLALATGGPWRGSAALLELLPQGSAARWRLRQIDCLVRLRDGVAGGKEGLLALLDEAGNDFARWQACLGLLQGGLLAPREAELFEAAARCLEAMEAHTRRHPALAAARRAFLEAGPGTEAARAAARLLLAHSPY